MVVLHRHWLSLGRSCFGVRELFVVYWRVVCVVCWVGFFVLFCFCVCVVVGFLGSLYCCYLCMFIVCSLLVFFAFFGFCFVLWLVGVFLWFVVGFGFIKRFISVGVCRGGWFWFCLAGCFLL